MVTERGPRTSTSTGDWEVVLSVSSTAIWNAAGTYGLGITGIGSHAGAGSRLFSVIGKLYPDTGNVIIIPCQKNTAAWKQVPVIDTVYLSHCT